MSARARFLQLFPQSAGQFIAGTGIATAEAFGSATVVITRTITTTGIASAQAFGSAAISQPKTITATGIASAQAFGSAAVAQTNVITLTGNAIASAEAFGSLAITVPNQLAVTGIASAEAFGSPAITFGPIAATGIASAEAFGSAALRFGPIVPAGIASAEAFGSASVAQTNVITTTGIASAGAFGAPTILRGGNTIDLTGHGIASGEAIGAPVVALYGQIYATGIPSAEAFGSAAVARRGEISLDGKGIASREAFGSLTLRLGPIVATAIPSAEAFGSATVKHVISVLLTGHGIVTAEAFGAATLTGDIRPIGIESAEAFGLPRITGGVSRVRVAAPAIPRRMTIILRPTLTSRSASDPALSQQLASLDINPDIVDCQMTTTLPGGFATLTVTLKSQYRPGMPYLSQPANVIAFAHVEAYVGTLLVWEGRVMTLQRPAGIIRGFTAVGYGLTATKDGVYPGRFTASDGRDLIIDALQHAAPLLVAGDTAELERTYVSVPAPNYTAPANVIDSVVKGGNSAGDQLDYTVYAQRRVNLHPRVAPALADYVIPWDDTVDLTEDYSEAYGGVWMAGENHFSDPEFRSRYGFQREIMLPDTADSNVDASITAIALTYLKEHSQPARRGTVTRTGARGLETPTGAEIPAYAVKSGEWIQIGLEDGSPKVVIVNTSYQDKSRQGQFEVGQPAPTLHNQIRALKREAAYQRTGFSVTTGRRLDGRF